MDKKRVVWADLLRIVSIFCVVVLHVSGKGWTEYSFDTHRWMLCNIFDGLTRFCVPVFVMLSGMTFLDPDKKINLKRSISRIAAAYVFWSALYAFAASYREGFGAFFSRFVKGHYHLWFLYMIAGLYLITPFLRKITADRKLCEYYMLLSFLFALLLPTLRKMGYPLEFFDKFGINFVMGYSGYFVAGYYFYKNDSSRKARCVLYALGVTGSLITVFGTYLISMNAMTAKDYLYSYYSPNVMLASVALFVAFKNLKTGKINTKRIERISRLTFGIYLVHDLFLTATLAFSGASSFYMTVPFIFIVSTAVFAVSLFVSYVISLIPVLNRYII